MARLDSNFTLFSQILITRFIRFSAGSVYSLPQAYLSRKDLEAVKVKLVGMNWPETRRAVSVWLTSPRTVHKLIISMTICAERRFLVLCVRVRKITWAHEKCCRCFYHFYWRWLLFVLGGGYSLGLQAGLEYVHVLSWVLLNLYASIAVSKRCCDHGNCIFDLPAVSVTLL